MEQTMYLCIGIGLLACSLVLFFIGLVRRLVFGLLFLFLASR